MTLKDDGQDVVDVSPGNNGMKGWKSEPFITPSESPRGYKINPSVYLSGGNHEPLGIVGQRKSGRLGKGRLGLIAPSSILTPPRP